MITLPANDVTSSRPLGNGCNKLSIHDVYSAAYNNKQPESSLFRFVYEFDKMCMVVSMPALSAL